LALFIEQRNVLTQVLALSPDFAWLQAYDCAHTRTVKQTPSTKHRITCYVSIISTPPNTQEVGESATEKTRRSRVAAQGNQQENHFGK
jgi:hypothetical protein